MRTRNKTKLISLMLASILSIGLYSCKGSDNPSSSTDSTQDNTSVTDPGGNKEILFKLYYYRQDNDSSFNNIWFWSDESGNNPGAGYQFFDGTTKTFPETGDMVWQEAVITADTYKVTSQWSLANEQLVDLTVDLSSFSGGLIIRTSDGLRQTGELKIDTTQLASSEKKEIFYVDKGDKIGGNFFYDVSQVPSYSVTNTFFTVNGLNQPTLEFTTKNEINFTSKDIEIKRYRYSQGVKSYDFERVELSSTIRKIGFKRYRVDVTNFSTIDPTYKYEMIVSDSKGTSTYEINMQTYYSTPLFETNYTPDMDMKLGSFIRMNNETGKEETVFRIWAPFATKVGLSLYKDAINQSLQKVYYLNKIGNGVFEQVVEGNLGGTYYVYSVYNYGKSTLQIPDPYAESGNANSKRSMVVDWNSELVDPSYNDTRFDNGGEFGDWESVNYSTVVSTKATVSELHVRDFSSDESWTGKKENVGKYEALFETGLTLENSSTKIGYDYVKSLAESGLTHIQLLPIYDFASVDETKLDDPDYQNKTSQGIFNWGYDPQSYNSPEGSYSKDPNDGYLRIRELRKVIQAFSKAGLGVVMDVVYNHMPSKNSTVFNKVVPDYYFRTQDVSGAGATMNSTRKMFRKYMVDSITMWTENYKMSGFRFDLMGILDAKTMMLCSEAMHNINPNGLMYGEGWQMYSSTGDQGPDEMMASQKNLQYFGDPRYTDSGLREEKQYVGAFNDNYRDAMHGGTGNFDNKGFFQRAYDRANTNNSTERKKTYYGLLGTNPFYNNLFNLDNSGNGFDAYIYNPYFAGASVNYTECHDNLTSFDKYYGTMQNLDIAKGLSAVTNAVTAMGLGVSFYQFGQEFGRTKEITDPDYLADAVVMKSAYEVKFGDGSTHYFSHNSYNTGDVVNSIDWTLVEKNNYMVEMFKGAISARQQIAEVTDFSKVSEVYYSPNDNFGITDYNTLVNTVSLMTKTVDGKNLYFFANPTNSAVTINVPYGGSAYVIAGDNYHTNVSGQMTVNSLSYTILVG